MFGPPLETADGTAGSEKSDPAKEALVAEQRRASGKGAGDSSTSGSRHGKQVSFSLHESTTVDDLVCEAARRVGLLKDGKSVTKHKVRKGAGEERAATDSSTATGSLFRDAADCVSRCRLRHYDMMNGVMLAPIEWAAVREKAAAAAKAAQEQGASPASQASSAAEPAGLPAVVLKDLDPALGPHRPLLLEVKASAEAGWAPWRPGGLPLRLACLATGRHQFSRPHQIVIDDDSAVSLRRTAATYMKLPSRLVRLFVLSDSGPIELGVDKPPGALLEPHSSEVDKQVAAEALADREGALKAAEDRAGLGGSAESGADMSVGATDVRD